jgi:Domain of unknown function (DUF4224)
VIISKEDLVKLTGYVRASAQIRWFRHYGWRFTVNGLGDPVVAVAEFNRHLVGGKAASIQEPNWDALNARRPTAKAVRP